MEIVKINASDYGLEETKAKEIQKGLSTILEERKVLTKSYLEVVKLEINEENIPVFKELRLKISKNRTQGIVNWHKTNKAFYLAGGRFVDAIKNKEIVENERMEAALLDAEKHFENLEKAKEEEIKSKRIALLKPYYEDAEMLPLGTMEQDVFDAYLNAKKESHIVAIAAEKEAEEKRVAEAKAELERQVEIEKENKRLKAEADLKAKQDEKERLEREQKEALKIAADKKEREEREAKEAADKAKQDAILKAEREAKEKLEAELKAKNDADAKAAKDKKQAIEAELKKGDAEKIKDLIKDLNVLKTKYEFKSAANKAKYKDVAILIDKVTNHIKK